MSAIRTVGPSLWRLSAAGGVDRQESDSSEEGCIYIDTKDKPIADITIDFGDAPHSRFQCWAHGPMGCPSTSQFNIIKRLMIFYEQTKLAEGQSGRTPLSDETIQLISRIWEFARAKIQAYATQTSIEHASMDSDRYYVAALVGLNEAIGNADPVALFGIATFAFFDVCDGLFGEWKCHLYGASSLLDIHCRNRTDLDRISQETAGLTEIMAHLVWFDTMGNDGLVFRDWHREILTDEFFAVVGCPHDTFELSVALAKGEAHRTPLEHSFKAIDQLLRLGMESTDHCHTANAWRCTSVIALLSRVGDASSVSQQTALSTAVDSACKAIASIPPTSRFYIHLAAIAYLSGINATTIQQCDIVRAYWQNCQSSDMPRYPDGQVLCEEKWRVEGLC